ncbi:MAG: zinc-ribbon domain-containing protein [Clostridiales Family XIII bacterium]|jgi:uncharacterized membrane protein|nr:zinc-ribbon domain-containing protein [Clostridiales Family XIII bacterium]
MKFCVKCGAELPAEATFCPQCGERAEPNAAPSGDANQNAANQYSAPNMGSYGNPNAGANQYGNPNVGGPNQYGNPNAGSYGNPGVYVNYADPISDAQANKAYGILAYLGILVLISIFAAPKESKYSRYHANQGLVFFIAQIVVFVGLIIISSILTGILFAAYAWGAAGAVAILFAILYWAVGITSLVFMILGIVGAANNQCKPLPIIGRMRILK